MEAVSLHVFRAFHNGTDSLDAHRRRLHLTPLLVKHAVISAGMLKRNVGLRYKRWHLLRKQLQEMRREF